MSASQRRRWAKRVAQSLRQHASREIIVLAGNAYLGWVGDGFSHVSNPLKGLGIGQRLAWFNRQFSAVSGAKLSTSPHSP